MTVSTVFSVESAHPTALSYFGAVPREPIPGQDKFVAVNQRVGLADIAVETLLRQIIASKVGKGGSIIVVSHGNERGLRFTLGAARGIRLEAAPIQVLRFLIKERSISEFEAAKRLKFGTFQADSNPQGIAQVQALVKLLTPVQELGLARVDLRACNTGKSRDTLEQLAWFFNCKHCCAPDSYDSFGSVPFSETTTTESKWKAFRDAHPNAIEEVYGGERMALDYKILAGEHKVMLAAIATSEEAVKGWARKHLPTSKPNMPPLIYHGLTHDQKTLIFAGDSGYRDRLVEVAQPESMKVTTDGPLERP